MLSVPTRLAVPALILGCFMPPQAFAQYDAESEDRVWFHALLDIRLARGGSFEFGRTASLPVKGRKEHVEVVEILRYRA